jgi:beta-lactamase class A
VKIKIALLLLGFSILSCSNRERDAEIIELPPIDYASVPYSIPDSMLMSLRDLIDPALQARLIDKISSIPKWKQLMEDKKLAIGLVDISDPYHVKYARINGNYMMYAASLPKIAILLAGMDAMEKGELAETPEVKSDLRLMISKSDNSAATRMIDRLGYDKIESVLTDPRYELYDEQYGGGLWVGKRYAKTGDRHPDPIKGLSHAATVSQVCRYYYLMVFGQLVSHERSQQMLAYMADPELHHKFVNTLDKVAPDARFYRKSGSWQNFHADSIMVIGPDWRRYILVALTEDPAGESIMRQLVIEIEDVLHGGSS